MTNEQKDRLQMTFGKYKGFLVKELPKSYLLWLKKQSWIEDWKLFIEYLFEHVNTHENINDPLRDQHSPPSSKEGTSNMPF